MAVRIDHATTSGTFSLDGRISEVDNNVWVVGDDDECVVIDAPHDANAILDLVGERKVRAILLTHGHDDHVGAVGALWDETGATIYLHPADRMLWDRVYPGVGPDSDIVDGQVFAVGDTQLHAFHTPGHSRGSVCFHAPALNAVFTGDTLAADGPGATGGSFSDGTTLIGSIKNRLTTLPPNTIVYSGHSDPVTMQEATAVLHEAAADRG